MMGVMTGFFGHLIWMEGVSGRRRVNEDEVTNMSCLLWDGVCYRSMGAWIQ